MGNSAFTCKYGYKYSNGAVTQIGSRRIILPSLDSNFNPASSPDGGIEDTTSWRSVTAWSGGTGYTAFGNKWFQPTGLSFDAFRPFSDGLTVNEVHLSWSDLETLSYNGIVAMVFWLDDVRTGTRRIELEFENRYSDDNDHRVTLEWKYYLNDVLKVDLVSAGARSAFGAASTRQINVFRQLVTFPWLMHVQDVEGIYYLQINANYFCVSDVPTPLPGNFDIKSHCVGVATGTTNAQLIQGFHEWLGEWEPEPYEPTENPYGPGDDDPYGPGNPDWNPNTNPDYDDDDPQTDDLPLTDAVGTGFATIFTPNRTQLKNLANLMWNKSFLEFVRNLVEDVSNLFVSLAMVPFVVPAGSTVNVKWFAFDTGVSLTLAAQQFIEINMGTINFGGEQNRAYTYASALDYSPFSSLGIYLPFIGFKDLDIDEFRDKSIHLRYRIDILSGECVAILRVDNKDIYQFTGNCLSQIPISNSNMQSIVSDAVNVGIAAATLGTVAGAAAAEEGLAASGVSLKEMGELAHTNPTVARSAGNLVSCTANAAMGLKPHISKTGSVSGSAAMMAVRQPYLFLRTPRQAIPSNYGKFCGYPSNIGGRLGDFSGFTVVENIRLNGLVATSNEIAEIYSLLKQGVIV